MRQVASLKVCVLGGRSFGKTSLLSSLIAISGTKESGISTLGDNQRKLDIYNDYKEGHGKLSATSWDDICQFRYKITGNEKKRWEVSFIDYPGEFFQDFFVDEKFGTFFNGVLAKLKSPGRDGKIQHEKKEDHSYREKEKKVKAIVKEILSADALIVLLPADCERPEYKNLLSTFKTRLEALLQVIEERNPHIPVCLAINKSDMLENTAIEDFLERPVFAGFHNMLSRERGQDYFYQLVSAFGGNKATGLSPDTENIEDLRQTWDGKSEPQNVLSMLIKVSEMAEEGRYKLLRERFDKASSVAKTLKWPFSWFHVRGLGANKEEDRKYCVKNLFQCAVRFGFFILISACSVFCAMSTVSSLNAWFGLSDYEKKLYAAEQSCKGDKLFILDKGVIKKLNDDRPKQLGKLVFFCKPKVESLKKRYEDIEDDRNWRVFTTVRKECEDAKLCDGGDCMDVEERLNRFDARIDRYQKASNEVFGSETRIGTGESLASRGTSNLLVGEKLNQIIAAESEGKRGLDMDKSFYQDLVKVYSPPDKDFCKKAEGFLQQYQSVKEHLKSKCDKVKTDMESHEKDLTADADSYLQQHADVPNSENYKDRISRAELRINKVQKLFEQSSTKLPSKKRFDDVRINAEELVRNLKADAPCYEALKKLREDNATIATGKVRRIYAFLDQYKQYDRCEKFKAPFRCEYSNELSRIQSQCLNNVTNNYVKDSQPTAEKIKRIQNQIAAYQCAYNEYVIGGDEFRQAEGKINELKKCLGEYEESKNLEDNFAKDLEKVYKSEEGTFCREAEVFLDKYRKHSERFKDQYGKLEQDKHKREEQAKRELQSYLDTHKDDETSEDYQNRIRQAENRIAAIDSFIQKIGLKSSFRGQCLHLKSNDETLIGNLKCDAPFYKALAELHTQNQQEVKGKIRRNDAFLKAHKDYLRCKRFWTSVREDLSNEVRRIQRECLQIMTNNYVNDSQPTVEKIERIKKQIAAYQIASNEYVIGSDEFLEAEGKIKDLKVSLGEYENSNNLEKAFAEDLEKVYKSEDGAFCREAEMVLDKYIEYCERFKDQYGKLEKGKQSREQKAQTELRNFLDTHKDDETSEDYQNRIRQAENRIAAIDTFIQKIGLKSSFRGQYLHLKSNDELLIGNLKSDAPFYKALAELHTQNQQEVKGKIRRNDAFLKAYTGYLRCKKFLTSVREDYSNEVRRVQNECRTVVTNNSIDVRGISTGKKIERIDNQIKAYENARDEYVIGSVEFRNAEKSISQLNGTRVAAQKMNDCEVELNRIKASSYNGRLKALAKFKNDYYEILTAEQNVLVTNLEEEALNYWQDYQSTNEWRYAIKEDDPLDVQKLNADKLETVYSTLMGEVLPNSPHYTLLGQTKQELGDRKRAIERDQKLENAFRTLPSTNAVERCQLLNAIDVFESKYHDADYTSKHAKQVFGQLKQRKDEAGRAFWSDYTNQIDKIQCPPETNFLARCQWADACRKMSEESYNGLGSNNVIRHSLEAKHKGYEEQYRRFAKFFDLASRANEIANKSPTNDVRVACDRLSEIKKFYSTYPSEANQDPLVGGYYSKVKDVQERNEGFVSQYINTELRKMDGKLPYGAAEEKKLAVWNEEIDLLGAYIPKLIKGSNPHTVYTQRLTDLQGRFDVASRKDKFDKDYKKLNEEINNEQDLKRKSQKVNEFLTKNDDVRSNDFARDKIMALKRMAFQNDEKIKFNDFNGRLGEVVMKRPNEDADEGAFTQFKAVIESLQRELNKFGASANLKPQCHLAAQKLKEQLEYIEKALGDGSWKAIQQREEEYKNNPCEATEKKLRTALANFDEKRFGKYLDNKKNKEKDFENDIELRNKVSSSKISFFDNPSHSTFVEFENAVIACIQWENTYGCKWPFVKECSTYISKIKNGIQVELKMESVYFSGSWKSVEISVVQVGDLSPDRFYHKLFKGNSMPETFRINVTYSKGLAFNVKYKNFTAYGEAYKIISFWDILKGGASSGEYSPSVTFQVEEKYWGSIQLFIQGIPYMP